MEKKTTFEKSSNVLKALLGEFSSVFLVNLEEDRITIFQKSELLKNLVPDQEEIPFRSTGEALINNLVMPAYKGKLRYLLEPANLQKKFEENKVQSMVIPCFTEKGIHYFKMSMARVDEDEVCNEIVFGFEDKHMEVLKEMAEEKLQSDYVAIFVVDLDTNRLNILKAYGVDNADLQQDTYFDPKKTLYYEYLDKRYESDFEPIASTANIRKFLSEEDAREVTFRSTIDGGKWIRCTLRVMERRFELPKLVMLCFAVLDNQSTEQMDYQRVLSKNLAVVAALSDNYEAIYYVSLRDSASADVSSTYRESETLSRVVPGWFIQNSFRERVKLLVEHAVHPDDRERVLEETRRARVLTGLLEGNAYYVDFRALIDGEETNYQMKFSADFDEEAFSGIRGLVVGLHNTDEEINQERVRQKEQKEARIKAEAANIAKSSFLFNMSHDIRTPMNAIIGFTDKAAKNIYNPEVVADCLAKVKSSNEYLLRLLNDVLDMARIESGKIVLEEKPANLIRSVEATLEPFKFTASTSNVEIECDFSNVKDTFAYHDELRVRQLLSNLLSNSIKYTKDGGKVELVVNQLSPRVEGKSTYEFIVRDNGIGMSESFVSKIFEQFSREQNTTVSGIQGTGLGMSIVQKLVEMMNGDIDIESELGVGTTVRVVLDLTPSEKVVEVEFASNRENRSISGIKALLVEDNELNREIAYDILTEFGMIIDTAEDGDIAVEKIKNSKPGQYDLIFMDIQMPRMNGYEATGHIRNLDNKELAEIPILAMTANAFEEDRKKAFESGMNGHVAKPINVLTLTEAILKVVR